MAFNFLERLGTMFGRSAAERVLGRGSQTAEAPAEAEAAPAAEAPAAETYQEPAPEPVAEAAPAAEAPAYVEPAPVVAEAAPADVVAAAPEAAVAEAPAEPAKSAEELEEERLWGETEAAWAAGDFQKVTESLDALKVLQPEDAAEIDEKIAAAQFNQASALEQSGELERALYLFQEAQRRNPNLGEAGFAIERVQAALQPPAEAEPVQEAAPPAEQSYTVADGDTLWAIAERHYGDGSQYTRIFEANRDQLDNPDVIQPGQVLRIPA
jgi:nucleoid-associated protein YgaU